MAKSSIGKAVAEPFVKRIESLEGRKDDIKAKAKEECDEIGTDQASVYEDAQANGLPIKAMKAYVKRRKLERKINDLDEGLKPEEQAIYVGLVEKLGSLANLPLGKAAIKAAAEHRAAH